MIDAVAAEWLGSRRRRWRIRRCQRRRGPRRPAAGRARPARPAARRPAYAGRRPRRGPLRARRGRPGRAAQRGAAAHHRAVHQRRRARRAPNWTSRSSPTRSGSPSPSPTSPPARVDELIVGVRNDADRDRRGRRARPGPAAGRPLRQPLGHHPPAHRQGRLVPAGPPGADRRTTGGTPADRRPPAPARRRPPTASAPSAGAMSELMQTSPDPYADDPLPDFATEPAHPGRRDGRRGRRRGPAGPGRRRRAARCWPGTAARPAPATSCSGCRWPCTGRTPASWSWTPRPSAYAQPLAALAAERLSLHLENDRLRRADLRRQTWLTFLAEASELLAQSLDVELTMALIPQLVVPRLGQWCAVHTTDEWGRLQLAAASHADESVLPAAARGARGDRPGLGPGPAARGVPQRLAGAARRADGGLRRPAGRPRPAARHPGRRPAPAAPARPGRGRRAGGRGPAGRAGHRQRPHPRRAPPGRARPCSSRCCRRRCR